MREAPAWGPGAVRPPVPASVGVSASGSVQAVGSAIVRLWQETAPPPRHAPRGCRPAPLCTCPRLRSMLRDLFIGLRARRSWMAIFVILCVVTLVVALLPADRAPEASGWDKLDHALAFAALGVAGVFALHWLRRGVVLVLPLLTLLGALIELLQVFVPSRMADVGDLLADIVGAVIGTLAAWLVLRAFEVRQRDPAGPRGP